MKRLAVVLSLAVVLGGCQSVTERLGAVTSAAPEVPATVDCTESRHVLKYHMSVDQRRNLTDTLRNQGCAAD